MASLLLSGNEGCWIGVVKPGRLVRTADRAVAGYHTSLESLRVGDERLQLPYGLLF